MNWNIIISDDPQVKARWSNDVVITTQEDAEIGRLVDLMKARLEEMRGTDTIMRILDAAELRKLRYTPGPNARTLYYIAASRIEDPTYAVGTHSYDSLSSDADDQYFVISEKHSLDQPAL